MPKTTAVATYQWLVSRGYSPIEILPKSKHPNNGEGWSKETYQADPDYFARPDANVGARLGHGGLRDIDIDCDEAAFYATHLLPATDGVFGRKGAPKSHYLYEVPPTNQQKFALVDPVIQLANKGLPPEQKAKAAIIDLRGLGQYTVMPGSVHMGTGQDICWEGDTSNPNIPRVEVDELATAIRLVAICVQMERHFWLEGQRHDVCRMLSGVFYFLDIPLDVAERMMSLVMERCDDDDQSRLKTLRMTYKKADEGKKTEGRTKLKAFLPSAASCLDQWSEWFGGQGGDVLDEYNERFAVVRYGSDVRIAAFYPAEPVEFLRKNAFFDLYSTETVQVPDDNGKILRVPKAKIWWASHKRAQYSGVTFAPSADPEDPALQGRLNLWRGWGIEPLDCTWQEAAPKCHMWLEHLRVTICDQDPDLYAWCLAWFAHMLRRPNEKPGTALALLGGQGAGKTSVFEYLRPVLEKAYVRIAQPGHLTGNFNSHMQNCLLLHAEEAVFANSHKNMGILKDLITSDYIQLEKKGQDIVSIPSFKRMGFTSNSDHMIGVERDDRRYTFINLGKRRKDASRKAEYEAERRGDGPAALFRYLLDCDEIDVDLALSNFITKDVATQKFHTFDPVEAWWYDVLQNGNLLHPSVAWCQRPENDAWPNAVSGPALFVSYKLWARGRRYQQDMSDVTFTHKLRQMLGDHRNLDSKMKRRFNYLPPTNDDGDRIRYNSPADDLNAQQISFPHWPSLNDCRALFEEYAHLMEHEWTDVTEEFEKLERPEKHPAPAGAQAF